MATISTPEPGSTTGSVIQQEPSSIDSRLPAWFPRRLPRHPSESYYYIRLTTTILLIFSLIMHIIQTIAIHVNAMNNPHYADNDTYTSDRSYPAFYSSELEIFQIFTLFFLVQTSLFDLLHFQLNPAWIVCLDLPLIIGNTFLIVIRWVNWVSGFVYKCYEEGRWCHRPAYGKFQGVMGATVIFTTVGMLGVAYCWVVNVHLLRMGRKGKSISLA
ncbi:hypothetical protein BJ508DRAFT_417312 [Ascobolus immersus RN42]|uniref:Uncharacterized protein n=1 Tax=Ascobolus immersus RN42 TaxID=1160509 RepID=A0A3N4HTC4_ASCIM|nr:hypothetical protein BJ508DRAFT_417312 [Ascobolus immersus RN42]